MTFLDIFSSKKISLPKKVIVVDTREANSFVPIELKKKGFEIEFRQLLVADYLVGDIAIERKTVADFKSSIINKRIVGQLLELRQYPTHFLIVEGIENENIYSGQIHENAFRGMILSIVSEFKVPIIFTYNSRDTADYISVLANRRNNSNISLRPSKILMSENEQIQFILEGFPGIGPASAKKLISEFKTLKHIANAPLSDLEKVIGKTAERFYRLLNLT
ncbi:MAG: ERCC4 domain-containing protein [Candidatus Pacearchaeota archaeon]